MRTNYNDSSNRNGRYNNKRPNNGGGGRRPSGGGGGRRGPGGGHHSNNSNGTVNVASATSARNKYLDMAKEALSNGNRVEAENYYQHAEHYSKLLNAAMATKREREEAEGNNGQRRHNNGSGERAVTEENIPESQPNVNESPAAE